MKLIGNGAEANVYLDGTNNSVVKRRVQKTYRISEIDSKMRVHRTRREAKILKKLEGLCPLLLDVDERNGKIIMEHLETLHGLLITNKEKFMEKKYQIKMVKL